MLRRIKIDSITYQELLDRYPDYIEHCDDINKYQLKGYTDKKVIKGNENEMIIQGYRLNSRYEKEIVPDWMQVVCVKDDSLDYRSTTKVIWSSQANKAVNTILDNYYTEEEKDALYALFAMKEKPKYLTIYLPRSFHDGKVHKFTGCRYYDINKAHTDALCEIFPKAAKDLIKLTNKDKMYINMFVGDMCNNGHRETYNWICQRTYDKVMNYIQESRGFLLYAKTDGFIVWCPNKELQTSDKLGEIKQQSKDGIVYAYRYNEKGNSYTLYQYDDIKTGITKKGTARLEIRKDIDLSIGQVVKAKLIDKVEIIEEQEDYEIF